jgi:hypothetical protein
MKPEPHAGSVTNRSGDRRNISASLTGKNCPFFQRFHGACLRLLIIAARLEGADPCRFPPRQIPAQRPRRPSCRADIHANPAATGEMSHELRELSQIAPDTSGSAPTRRRFGSTRYVASSEAGSSHRTYGKHRGSSARGLHQPDWPDKRLGDAGHGDDDQRVATLFRHLRAPAAGVALSDCDGSLKHQISIPNLKQFFVYEPEI